MFDKKDLLQTTDISKVGSGHDVLCINVTKTNPRQQQISCQLNSSNDIQTNINHSKRNFNLMIDAPLQTNDSIPMNPNEIDTRILNNTSMKALVKSHDDLGPDARSHLLSHTCLLTKYDQLVDQGLYQTIKFGKTIHSAISSIDRVVQKISNEIALHDVDEMDLEIINDLREYKRSLRSFSIYEDREKLALLHEIQEYLVLWSRNEGMKQRNKKNKFCSSMDNYYDQLYEETIQLSARPIIFTESHMTLRNASKNINTNNCVFGCCTSQYRITATGSFISNTDNAEKSLQYTLTPMIEPFDIDADSDTDSIIVIPKSTSHHRYSKHPKNTKQTKRHVPNENSKKYKATILALTELKHSLQFIYTYNQNSKLFYNHETIS